MNRTTLYLGLGTLFIFGFGGFLIIEYLQDQNFLGMFLEGKEFSVQLIAGILIGLAGSGIAWFIISRKFFEKEKIFYAQLVTGLNLDVWAILFLSLCAGIGEEIFFRAGIQPYLGVWWTSLLFVMLHGYLNPWNFRISMYGMVMVGIIAVFGYLFQHMGIFSAVSAHAVFDIVLFWKLSREGIRKLS
jgi:membrane protease YdiL (CAAX protease family)